MAWRIAAVGFAETRVIREGFQLLKSRRFQSVPLARLSERVKNWARSLRRLERMLGALNQRDKEGYNFLSRLLLTGTRLYLAVEEWRRRHGAELREWLDAWENSRR
jgi:hypothetical protein